MAAKDLDAVLAIAAETHPSLPESREVLEEKLRLHPAGCRCLAADYGKGSVAGYFFSHPWYYGDIPDLNCLLGQLPALTQTYYLHDLSLLPSVRGGGHAGCAVRYANHHAHLLGYTKQALVSVNGSEAFWRRQGFEWTQIPELELKLPAYGQGARYMVRLTA